MTEDVDKALIAQITREDKSSFASLVERYQERALKVAYFHTFNWQDAEEVAQDAFVKVFKKIHTFKGEAKFSTWFYRILINQCYDFLRKHKMRKVFEWTNKEEGLPDPLLNIKEKGDPRASLLNDEMKSFIDHAVMRLPKQQKTVFIFHYLRGKKLSEIAVILKMSEGGVKANLFQAREKLKASLSPKLSHQESNKKSEVNSHG